MHVSNAAPKAEQMRNSMQNYQTVSRNPPGPNSVMGSHHDSMSYGDARGGSGNGGNISDHPRNSFNNPGRGENNAMNQNAIVGMRGYGINTSNYSGGGNNTFGTPLGNNMGGMNCSMTMSSNSGPGGPPMNRSDISGPYQRGSRGNYINNHIVGPHGPHGGNNSSSWNNNHNRNLDMPNLQTLGINSQGPKPAPSAQNLSNSLGVGLNLSSLPMNPAIVAAALNQWSILGNQLQNQPQDQVKYINTYNIQQEIHFFSFSRLVIFCRGWLTQIIRATTVCTPTPTICTAIIRINKAATMAIGHPQ